MRTTSRLAAHLTSIALIAALAAYMHASDKPRSSQHAVKVIHQDFHGWPSILLRSPKAEVVIVPAIGRVMQFNLIDDDGKVVAGPLWNQPGIGIDLKPDSEGWTNYGGDKAWPAPQSDWPGVVGSGWPPPKGFDAVPVTAIVKGSSVELLSPVDKSYGIRVRRTVTLDSQKPVLKINTTYEKTQGAPVRVAVWTITQLNSPERAFVFLPEHSTFPDGYHSFLPTPPADLKREGRMLSLIRSPDANTMIGSDGNALLWVGEGPDLLIQTEATHRTGEFPEMGSHTKIYTNGGNAMKYVELECLGPLQTLKAGDKVSLANSYSLIRRTNPYPVGEAQKAFSHP